MHEYRLWRRVIVTLLVCITLLPSPGVQARVRSSFSKMIAPSNRVQGLAQQSTVPGIVIAPLGQIEGTGEQPFNYDIGLRGRKRVEVSGNYAFVTSFDSGLHIFDITSPSHPQRVMTFDPFGDDEFPLSVLVNGEYAYVHVTNNGTDNFYQEP